MSDGYDIAEIEKWFFILCAHWDKYGFGKVAVFLKETGEFMGYAGFAMMRAETLLKSCIIPNEEGLPDIDIGYRLHKKFWGKRYGTELAIGILKVILKKYPSIIRVFAMARDDNAVSRHILYKCMFTHINTMEYEPGKRWSLFHAAAINIRELVGATKIKLEK